MHKKYCGQTVDLQRLITNFNQHKPDLHLYPLLHLALMVTSKNNHLPTTVIICLRLQISV